MKSLKYFFGLVLIVLISIIIDSCKKYDEGPTISFNTKRGRLTNTWNMNKFMIDNHDITSTSELIQIMFDRKKNFTQTFRSDSTVSGTWAWSNKKEFLILTFPNGINLQWKIVRLTHKELWVTFIQGQELRRYEFQP